MYGAVTSPNANGTFAKPKSAYQFFFEERKFQLMEGKSTEMIRVLSPKLPLLLSEAWAQLSEENRADFCEVAENDKLRYKSQILQYEIAQQLQYQIEVLRVENDDIRNGTRAALPNSPARLSSIDGDTCTTPAPAPSVQRTSRSHMRLAAHAQSKDPESASTRVLKPAPAPEPAQTHENLHAGYKSAPLTGASGKPIPEKYITYDDDNFLGKKLPDLESLEWIQGGETAKASLSSPDVKVVLFWAKFAKGDWLTIQQFENLQQKYPSVNFLGISCDPKIEECKKILKKADGSDYPEINLFKFKYTFPAAYDPDSKVKNRFMKVGGIQSMGAGYAFIIDKFQTIVWKEFINMTHLLPENQFLDQLDVIVKNGGSAKGVVIRNGLRPEDENEEEQIDVDFDEGLDAFDDQGNGDY
jgi:hypothetical protein